MDKGAAATLDAFLGLAPSNQVKVFPAILTTKIKSKPPAIRCISLSGKSSFDVGNVDSVEKVFRILNKHMEVKVRVTITHILCQRSMAGTHICND
jgi:hypothetical protein